jgi:hypothetical protein
MLSRNGGHVNGFPISPETRSSTSRGSVIPAGCALESAVAGRRQVGGARRRPDLREIASLRQTAPLAPRAAGSRTARGNRVWGTMSRGRRPPPRQQGRARVWPWSTRTICPERAGRSAPAAWATRQRQPRAPLSAQHRERRGQAHSPHANKPIRCARKLRSDLQPCVSRLTQSNGW